MKGRGIGFGKAILFNEHFVVYGIPSIVSAIGNYTVAHIEPYEKPEINLIDNRKATPQYKEDKYEQQHDSLNRILTKMNIDPKKQGLAITLEGNLYAASGIGASAASCVAIARALNQFYNMNLKDEEINEIAYEGEKGYHGNPSGVDNTASTYGGLIWFQKGDQNEIERIEIPNPIEIVIGNTGKIANTKAAVAGVRERKENNPRKYEEIFDRAENITYLAKQALEDEDHKEIGKLMNENHKLLQQIEVSSKELDFLVNIARENGALGAKLTGGGLGGNMIALTPKRELQERVATSIEKEGFQTIKTVIGATRGGYEG
ncbi:MAG: mevalonate kinase [Candidatus Thermoplasmatota archaeon]|nr:mevalonate kinase [Candidatus Thermoplasmatota archaeon]MBU1940314.1 mevalonate kinase [Candidatus Thermoplasmatota archaeon]